MANLLHQEITGAIIGAYYEVYNHTSRTLPEHLYEPRSSHQLKIDQHMPIPSAKWLHPDLVYAATGGLYEVHTALGAGFVHRIYANACHQELRLRGIAVKANKRMQIAYKGAILGDMAFGHLLIEDKLMVFPVAIQAIQRLHLDSLKDWMRMNSIQIGLLANFNAVSLDITIVRVVGT